jgi:hypothetical protein
VRFAGCGTLDISPLQDEVVHHGMVPEVSLKPWADPSVAPSSGQKTPQLDDKSSFRWNGLARKWLAWLKPYPRATVVSMTFSGDTAWNHVASWFLVSNRMKFGCGGRIVDGGVWRQLKHQDRPMR